MVEAPATPTKIGVFIKDLIFSTKLAAATSGLAVDFLRIKDTAAASSVMQQKPALVVVNLGITDSDPFEVVQEAVRSAIPVWCFYSHVEKSQYERARQLGAEHVYPRSSFFEKIKSEIERIVVRGAGI